GHEGAAVPVTQDAHQPGESLRTGGDAGAAERIGKADGMNPYPSLPVLARDVDPVDVAQDGFHGAALEFVAEHVDADLLFRVPERLDGIGDAVGRIAVAEGRPVPHGVLDRLA